MAAAGILVGGVGMGTAKAADLGGDCCADLEERVAELEATTVRKGNRKVSLSLSGQINKEIMYYRDDVRSRTIAGVDNINSSTRFTFAGDAKVTSSVKAGFEMMVEWAGDARSDLMTQTGPVTQYNTAAAGVVRGLQGSPLLGNGGVAIAPNSANLTIPTMSNFSRDGTLAVRTANWWLEDKVLGRVTVGRVNIQGPASTIDISGGDVSLIAWNNIGLQGGSMFLQPKGTTQLSATNMGFGAVGQQGGGYAPWCYGCSRDDGIRWDSASIGGFLFGAYWGQQDRFTAQVRYAGEFGGFQVAGGAGYQHDNQIGLQDPNLLSGTFFGNPATSGGITGVSNSRTDIEQQGYALSLKHIASGIFLQGQYGLTHYKWFNGANAAALNKPDGWSYHIQGGWAKNVTGAGITTLYGEYGHGQGYASGFAANNDAAAPSTGPANNNPPMCNGCNNSSTVNNGNFTGIGGVVLNDSIDYYGLGMTQKIDAASMTLYLGWRHFDPKITTTTFTGAVSSFDTVIGGARIQF